AVAGGAAQHNNDVASEEPLQDIVIPNAGSYFVAIQVVSGSNPGHVEFINVNENVDVTISQQFGSAGGTFYPGTFGHPTNPNTIGVGATPWWAPTPYPGPTPLASEPFRSLRPALPAFDVNPP